MLCELFLNKRTVLKEPKTRKGRCTSFFYLVILQLRKSSKFCHKRMLCDPFVVFFNFFALLTCQQKAPTFLKKRTLCDPFIKRTLLKERLTETTDGQERLGFWEHGLPSPLSPVPRRKTRFVSSSAADLELARKRNLSQHRKQASWNAFQRGTA